MVLPGRIDTVMPPRPVPKIVLPGLFHTITPPNSEGNDGQVSVATVMTDDDLMA